MSKYSELADIIIENVGGKENIINVTHCMTRLRFDLKDIKAANEEVLKSNPDIISTAHAAGKLQVIIGNAVADVFKEVAAKLSLQNTETLSSDKKEGLITRFTNMITKVITPTLGVLVATGLLKGLIAVLTAFNLIDVTSGTYLILNALGDALFYFFPVILGYTSAETFGLNKFLGMILGAVLIYPNIMQSMLSGDVIFQLLPNTPFAANAYQSFLGIPVIFPAAGYSSTVIPIIMITFVGGYVERFFNKYIPAIVGFAFTPFLTLLICAPLAFIVIGPIANMASGLITWMTLGLFDFSPVIAAIVVALIYQPLVIFGLHWPLITIALTNFTTLGYDFLWPTMFTASFAQTAVVLAVGLRTKNKQTKAMTIPAFISGLMCIIEPAIYGFTLPDKKRFAISCISAAVGGVIITVLGSVQYVLGVGLLGFTGFINPATGSMNNLYIAAAATIVTMILAFVLTYVTFKEVGSENAAQASTMNQVIKSPVLGEKISLSDVKDKTFASEILGKTIAVNPSEGVIIAPFDGVLETVFPTGHALGIIGLDGASLLIHIGIDTVNLQGKYFNVIKQQGEHVKEGDILVEFDIEGIKSEGLDPVVLLVLTNSADYQNLITTKKSIITYSDMIFESQL